MKDPRWRASRASMVLLVCCGDPVLMVGSLLLWLGSHFLLVAVCAGLSALLHYHFVHQVRPWAAVGQVRGQGDGRYRGERETETCPHRDKSKCVCVCVPGEHGKHSIHS